MVDYRSFWVGGAAFFVILGFCATGSAQTFNASVVQILSGDTVEVVDSDHRQCEIRLEGVDAPKEGQPFADESAKHLKELVFSRKVNLDCNREATYSRFVCKVRLGANDIDLDQIKAGMARHYKQFQQLQTAADRIAYQSAEDAARRAHLGLWADSQMIEPVDNRERTRRSTAMKMLITRLLGSMGTRGQ